MTLSELVAQQLQTLEDVGIVLRPDVAVARFIADIPQQRDWVDDGLLQHLDRITESVIKPTNGEVDGLEDFNDPGSPSVTVRFSSTAGAVSWTLGAYGDFVDSAAFTKFDDLLACVPAARRLWGLEPADIDDSAVSTVILNLQAQSVVALSLTAEEKFLLERLTPMRLVPISIVG